MRSYTTFIVIQVNGDLFQISISHAEIAGANFSLQMLIPWTFTTKSTPEVLEFSVESIRNEFCQYNYGYLVKIQHCRSGSLLDHDVRALPVRFQFPNAAAEKPKKAPAFQRTFYREQNQLDCFENKVNGVDNLKRFDIGFGKIRSYKKHSSLAGKR